MDGFVGKSQMRSGPGNGRQTLSDREPTGGDSLQQKLFHLSEPQDGRAQPRIVDAAFHAALIEG